MVEPHVDGDIDERFAPLRDLALKHIEAGDETGLSLAVDPTRRGPGPGRATPS
jgi:hypothetical protein